MVSDQHNSRDWLWTKSLHYRMHALFHAQVGKKIKDNNDDDENNVKKKKNRSCASQACTNETCLNIYIIYILRPDLVKSDLILKFTYNSDTYVDISNILSSETEMGDRKR